MYGADRKGKNNTFYGKKHSDETKALISRKKKGVSIIKPPVTDETRKKLSEARKGTGVKYHFIHTIHGELVCNIESLCEKYPNIFNKRYHRAELWKLATGLYKSCKGWQVINQD